MGRLTKWMGEHAAVVDNHANYIDRLAAYEDIGLTPEEIRVMLKKIDDVYRLAKQLDPKKMEGKDRVRNMRL